MPSMGPDHDPHVRGGTMTTLDNRPNTALLVIDVQNGVVGEAYDRDNVVANIGTLVDKARAADVDVVWVQHNSDELPVGQRELAVRARARAARLRAAGAEGVRRLLRGDRPGVGAGRARHRPAASSRARRPTSASARRCTARSSAATTRRWSATPTRPRTSRRMARRRPTRSSPTRTCTGSTTRLPAGPRARSAPPTSTSPRTPAPEAVRDQPALRPGRSAHVP